MEALKAERLLDSNKRDRVPALAAAPICYMVGAFHRLEMPSGSSLSTAGSVRANRGTLRAHVAMRVLVRPNRNGSFFTVDVCPLPEQGRHCG